VPARASIAPRAIGALCGEVLGPKAGKKKPVMATTSVRAGELSEAQLVQLLRNMLTQRAVDNRGFQLNRQGKVAIAMGSEGHEAVQAGAGMAFVRGKDVLYPYYRNTGITIA